MSGKVKNIYQQKINIKTSKIFIVFSLIQFSSSVLYFFSIKESETSLSISENDGSSTKEFFTKEFQNHPKTKKIFTNQNNKLRKIELTIIF